MTKMIHGHIAALVKPCHIVYTYNLH